MQLVILARIWLEGLIFSYERERLSATSYRRGAAGRCCRRRKRGGKIKTGRVVGIACGISAYCAYRRVFQTVFQRSEKTRPRETEGGGKHWDPSSGLANLKTRGDYIPRPSFISAKSVYCYDTSPFVVISRAIVVALFIMASRHGSGGRNEPLALSRRQ